MGESRRLIKNTGIIAIGNLCTKMVSFLLLPLYTAVLSTAEYGTVDYIVSISFFLVPVATMLMDEGVFRFLIDCRTPDDRQRVISSAFAVTVLGLGVTVAACVPILVLLRYRYSALLVLYVLSSSLLTMVSALLRGLGRTSLYAALNFAAGSSAVVLNVLLVAVVRLGVTGMLLASVVSVSAASVAFVIALGLWREVKVSAVDWATTRELLRYAIPLIPNKVSWTIMNVSGRLIIMNSLGASASGLYAVSYKFPNFMDMVYGFFYMSWKESSARALGSDEDEGAFYRAVYRALRRFMMSVVIGMVAFMPLVFRVMVAPSYHEGLLYVPILLLATYYSNISGFYGGIFTAYKDTGIMGSTTVWSAILNLVLNFVAIPTLGLWGSSLATLAALFLVNEYRRRKVSAYVDLGTDGRWSLLTAAVVALLAALYYSGAPLSLAAMVALAVAYFLVSNREVISRLLNRSGLANRLRCRARHMRER